MDHVLLEAAIVVGVLLCGQIIWVISGKLVPGMLGRGSKAVLVGIGGLRVVVGLVLISGSSASKPLAVL